MTNALKQILDSLMADFDAISPGRHYRSTVIGFITPPPDTEQYAIELNDTTAQLLPDISRADIVIQATTEEFKGGLLEKKISELLERAHLIGTGTFTDWMLKRFLTSFALTVPEQYLQSDKSYFAMPLRNPVGESMFAYKNYTPSDLPAYNPELLPRLVVDEHPQWVAMYNKAWELGFQNLKQVSSGSNFVSNYIDTAFNGNIFMWDSCFMMMFGRYGRSLFDFMGTLDNFYAKQHADGFICREISGQSGADMFTPFDSRSTGPNILAWTEWLDFQTSHNLERLKAVFPALIAYHLWWYDWRRWSNGGYWSSNLGSGMDNQTRITERDWHHEHYSWVDATMQQALNCRILQEIANSIGDSRFNDRLEAEYEQLGIFINEQMWNEETGFYYDVSPTGELSTVKSIGAYWGLLAGMVPPERAKRLISQLDNPESFKRFHRVPSQAANDPGYDEESGRYWRGGVWSPTNYMVLHALRNCGEHQLAYDIALNHVNIVAEVFQETGTLWENYAPEQPSPSFPAKRDFVGWTGISAICIPIEYLIGLHPNQEGYIWDIRLTERHGVLDYPLGNGQTGDFICEARNSVNDRPQCTVKVDQELELTIFWQNKSNSWSLTAGEHRLVFP